MEGRFNLYRQETEELESEVLIAYRQSSYVDSSMEIRVQRGQDINSQLSVKYGVNNEIESTIQAISLNGIDGFIEVPPHNRLLGRFELFEAPRVTKYLSPIADATTRSRSDLQTVNYGDTQSMMIGQSMAEEFESFVNFGDLETVVPDLNKLEEAKLRLYYSGSFIDETDIKIYQPNTLWREYGITHANKPYATELLADSYTVNHKEHYIEFELLDLVRSWQSKDRINYGFIIKSSSDHATYFNTRESDKPPVLILKYITSLNYSYGRTELPSSLIVYGAGRSDRESSLTVKSNIGLNHLEASLYVHKYKDPMEEEKDSVLVVSKPDVNSILKVVYRKSNELESHISIASKGQKEITSELVTSTPEKVAMITVDPNVSVKSILTVTKRLNEDMDSVVIINRPDINGSITVTPFKRTESVMDSEITIMGLDYYGLDSQFIISRPDINGELSVRAIGQSEVDSFINVPYYTDLDSLFHIRHHSDLESSITVGKISDTEADIVISNPALAGYLYPRFATEADLDSLANIRKRNAVDLNSFLIVKGRSSGVYWYIL